MSRTKLTIGMAVFDDMQGLWATIQALKIYHRKPLLDMPCEIIVVDNDPKTTMKNGKPRNRIGDWLEGWKGRFDIRYIPMADGFGTTQPRQRIFDEAAGEWVMVMDSHIFLFPDVINRVNQFIDANPKSDDLHCGPIYYDSLEDYETHFDLVWRDEMLGTWGLAWKSPKGQVFACEKNLEDGTVLFHGLDPEMTPVDVGLRNVKWEGHHQYLWARGFERYADNPQNPPLEVPAQGLGLFMCRKAAWPGFNRHCRGFGGEEGYIHEKFRQRGHKTLMHPWMLWNHRFSEPEDVTYTADIRNKVRNYLLEWEELGKDTKPIFDHFVTQLKRLTQKEWDDIAKDPVKFKPVKNTPLKVVRAERAQAPQPSGLPLPAPGTISKIEDLYQWTKSKQRDLNMHLEVLRNLATRCGKEAHITEITKRRESSIAFLAARPKQLFSIHAEKEGLILLAHEIMSMEQPPEEGRSTRWTTHGVDSLDCPPIEPTDLLFVDSQHNATRLRKELALHGKQVRRFLVFHDTAKDANGEKGDDGAEGLNYALREWVDQNPKWFVAFYTNEQYGLTVLSCNEEDRPPKTIVAWAPGWGAGTNLKKSLRLVGIVASPDCPCNQHAEEMDIRGPRWCEDRIETIVDWMEVEAKKRKSLLFTRTGARALAHLAIKKAWKQSKKRGVVWE